MFKRVGIIGVGLMGGSFALAFKEKFPQSKTVGFARKESSFKRLKKIDILDEVSSDLKKVVKGSDLLVLALPVSLIVDYLELIAPFLGKETVVMDLGSTKREIHRVAKKLLPKRDNFVGCHPLCGSEKSGAEYAYKDLYKGTLCLITSASKNKNVKNIRMVWKAFGAKVRFLTPGMHDKILSYISHFPHILSFSLTKLVPSKFYQFSSLSFHDMTRVSASAARLWTEIFLSNQQNINKNISEFVEILGTFKNLIEEGKEKELFSFIKAINRKNAFEKHLDTR
ncbi:MAG: prephenate dehydrogenase [Candidatus Omnitrophica bacterium]|nr:prephenate dehydrogenase [Candidatus Omnitrophota bacterium]